MTNSWDSTGLLRPEPQLLAAGWLDLDDVGAELCEQQPAVRAVVDLAQFEDPDAVKRRCHDRSRHSIRNRSGSRRRRDVGDRADALLGRRGLVRYCIVTASVSEWNVPSSLKLTCAPCIHHRATVSSVLSSGVKNVCTVPTGSYR